MHWGFLQGREVDDGDVFKFNADFSAALYRVKINAIQLRETPEENKKTNEQVLQDRQYQARLFSQLPCYPTGFHVGAGAPLAARSMDACLRPFCELNYLHLDLGSPALRALVVIETWNCGLVPGVG